MTQCWKILVAWSNGSEKLVHLKDIKESNNVDIVQCVKSTGIDEQLEFA